MLNRKRVCILDLEDILMVAEEEVDFRIRGLDANLVAGLVTL